MTTESLSFCFPGGRGTQAQALALEAKDGVCVRQARPCQVSLLCHGDKKNVLFSHALPSPLSPRSPLPEKFVVRDLTVPQINVPASRLVLIILPLADRNFLASLSGGAAPAAPGNGRGRGLGAGAPRRLGLPPSFITDLVVAQIRN